ncbi:TssQ family T6SS-associated lipoprotein [Massilia sp. TSP1-1-2]|uniref:TssQ family T6SS-associated lipoprotein n=1 Tax=unclassified Massilia TaxID=2609279 RepID=UPI003CEEBEB1
MNTISRTLLSALAGTLILSGCQTVEPVVAPKPAPVPQKAPSAPARPAPGTPGNPIPPGSGQAGAEQNALREGIDLYNKGSYNEAIKRLAAPEIANGAKADRVQALKYSAFSYCVTSRQTLCRQQFEKAFKLDPSFNLQPGEHGHPLWTPQFEKAKKAK